MIGVPDFGDDPCGPVAIGYDPICSAIAVQAHSGFYGIGNGSNKHALFAIYRTTHPTIPAVHTALNVAFDDIGFPAELVASIDNDPVVFVDQFPWPLGDVEPFFHGLEMLVEVFQDMDSMALAPEGDNLLRSAKTGGPVDGCTTPDTMPLENGNP